MNSRFIIIFYKTGMGLLPRPYKNYKTSRYFYTAEMELNHKMSPKNHSSLYKRTITLLLAAAMMMSATTNVFAIQLRPRDDEEDEEYTRSEALAGSVEARQQAEEEGRDYFADLENGEDWDLEADEEYTPRVSSIRGGSSASNNNSQESSTGIRVVGTPSSNKAGAVSIGGGSNSITVGSKSSTPTVSTPKTPTTVSALSPTIKSWQAKNSDVKAWLKVSGTNIDYPVLQSPKGNNTYYEALGIDKKYSKNGVIWASHSVNFGDSSTLTQNNCIFGHNWTNSWRYAYANRAKDVMFAQLVPFKRLDFAQQNQKIYYSTEYEDMTFQIFAVFICNANDLDYVSSTYTTKQFSSLISEVRSLSFFDYDIPVTTDDKLISLSTCIDAYYINGVRQTNQRLVVMGKLVKGSDATKNVTVTTNTDAKTPTGMGVRKDY